MQRFSYVLTFFATLAVFGIIVLVALPRPQSDGQIEVPGAKSDDPGAPQRPLRPGPGLPGLPPVTEPPPIGTSAVGTPKNNLVLHPLLGAMPPGKPAAPKPEGALFTEEELQRFRDENVRKVMEVEKARRRREIVMFEEIMGPLTEEQADAFLDIYNRYYEEASREFRDRVTRGDMPDRNVVYRQVRQKAYKRLASVLDPVQLDKFRSWWEKAHSNGK